MHNVTGMEYILWLHSARLCAHRQLTVARGPTLQNWWRIRTTRKLRSRWRWKADWWYGIHVRSISWKTVRRYRSVHQSSDSDSLHNGCILLLSALIFVQCLMLLFISPGCETDALTRALHGPKISSPARPEKGSAWPDTLQKNTGPARWLKSPTLFLGLLLTNQNTILQSACWIQLIDPEGKRGWGLGMVL